MREGLVHDEIINNLEVQSDLKTILSIDGDISLVHEDSYINGIIADFTLIHNNKVRAIIECKAGDINVTDYVRGIGQVMQYEYFCEESISLRNYVYDAENFKSVLFFPSSVITDNSFNIGRIRYPKRTILIEMNEVNKVIRKVEIEELKKLREATENNLVTVSQYYIRDNRLYEIYILLKYLSFLKLKGFKSASRQEIEKDFLIKLETPNNGNWRNAFISLSSLGLIDSKNIPTASGVRLANLEYEFFLLEVFQSYLKPYFDILLSFFSQSSEIELNNQGFVSMIKNMFLGRDVLFLSESKGRYISSWLNILRDDYGCIDFKSKSSKRTLKYNIVELNNDALIKQIKENSNGYVYLKRYFNILNT